MPHARAASPSPSRPRVVIVGAGFAGIAAAKALARAPVSLTVVDRRNHHLFQPLLYQVATAALSPADVAAPIRRVLGRNKNTEVILAEALAVDPLRQILHLADAPLPFDYLILAAGATHSYFGHDDWAPHAPGLKTIENALDIRRRILLAFEHAERATNHDHRRALLTFVVVGAGPTGVELAGALKEIACVSIPRDFKHIDTSSARIVLVEAQDRVLPGFPEPLSRRAAQDLARIGVELRLSTTVTHIDHHAVRLGNETLPAHNVLWAAGVKASPLGASLNTPLDRSGRVIVQSDLTVPGHRNIFVLGDLACAADPRRGGQVPGMCPGALQMGRYAGRIIARETRHALKHPHAPPPPRPPFQYHHKGSLATIGRAKAVAAVAGMNFAGLAAWLLWAFVHIFYLINFRNRFMVMLQWAWEFFVFDKGARLITDPLPPTRHPNDG